MNKLPRASFNRLWVKRSILRKCATADVTHRNDEQRQKGFLLMPVYTVLVQLQHFTHS